MQDGERNERVRGGGFSVTRRRCAGARLFKVTNSLRRCGTWKHTPATVLAGVRLIVFYSWPTWNSGPALLPRQRAHGSWPHRACFVFDLIGGARGIQGTKRGMFGSGGSPVRWPQSCIVLGKWNFKMLREPVVVFFIEPSIWHSLFNLGLKVHWFAISSFPFLNSTVPSRGAKNTAPTLGNKQGKLPQIYCRVYSKYATANYNLIHGAASKHCEFWKAKPQAWIPNTSSTKHFHL